MKKLILLIGLLLIIPQVIANEEIQSGLNEYYEAAKTKDLDRYVNSQDTLFLRTTMGEDYKAYYKALFELTDTLEYTINNPSYLIIDDNRAFVYYNLKAKVLIENEEVEIDNDMVGAMWNYGNGWKVRYTMLRTLFEEKLIDEIASEVNTLVIANLESPVTLKEYFEQEKIDLPIEENTKNETGQITEKNNFIKIAIIVGIIVIILFILKKRKH